MQTTPDYRRGLLFLISYNAALGSLAWGYCVGIFNSVRIYLQTHVFPDASHNNIALLASSLLIAASAGSYFSGKIVGRLGRRTTLIIFDIVGVVASLLSVIQSLPILILGRFIAGFVVGVNSAAVPLYNIEMSPIKMKGTIGSIPMVMLALGVGIGLSMSFFVPDGDDARESNAWRVLMGLPIVFYVARSLILVFKFKFETPFYLTLKGNTSEARAVLEMIYTDNIEQHMQKVIKDKEATTSASGNLTVRDLVTPKYISAFLMGLLNAAALQFTGFGPIFMFFSVFAGESAGNNQNTLAFFSTLLGLVSFFSTLLTAFVAEKFGRRPLLVYGTLALFINEAIYLVISIMDGLDNGLLKYLLIIWPISYRLSAGTLGFVYISELLPSSGIAFVTFVNWVCGFLLAQTCLPLVDLVGVEGLMFFYTAVCLVSYVLYDKYLIESKGKTKAELLELYSNITTRKASDDVEMKRIPLLQKL